MTFCFTHWCIIRNISHYTTDRLAIFVRLWTWSSSLVQSDKSINIVSTWTIIINNDITERLWMNHASIYRHSLYLYLFIVINRTRSTHKIKEYNMRIRTHIIPNKPIWRQTIHSATNHNQLLQLKFQLKFIRNKVARRLNDTHEKNGDN